MERAASPAGSCSLGTGPRPGTPGQQRAPGVRLPEEVSCRAGDGDRGKEARGPPCPQRALVSGAGCAVTSAHAGACFAASASFFVQLGEA